MNTKYQLESVNCCYCDSHKYSIYIENAEEMYIGLHDKFNVVRCDNCGLLYTNPRPTIETIDYFYPDNARYYNTSLSDPASLLIKDPRILHTLSIDFNYPLTLSSKQSFLRKTTAAHYKKTIQLKHIPSYVPNGKLLDIGCSWGSYLYKMKWLGWDVYGIETNSQAVRYAKKKLDLNNVFNGNLDDYSLIKNTFDVVRMGMVLEHLHHPLTALYKINYLLKPEGTLIFNIPNASSLELKIFGRHSYFLHIPQHLYHFTPATIEMFLRKSGFSIKQVLYQKSTKDWTKSVENTNCNFLKKCLNNKYMNSIIHRGLLNNLLPLTSLMGKTSRMTVYAKKTY